MYFCQAFLGGISGHFTFGNFKYIPIHLHKAKISTGNFKVSCTVWTIEYFVAFMYTANSSILGSFFQFCKCGSKGFVSKVNLVLKLSFSLFKKGVGICWCLFWQNQKSCLFLNKNYKIQTFERTPLVMSFAVDARARHVVIVCE